MKTLLHMHNIRSFINDRYSFYNNYINSITPRHHNFKGVQKAFTVGSAVDFAIKKHYEREHDDIYNSEEYNSLNKIDRATCACLIENYILEYQDERLQNVRPAQFKIPFGKYILLGSPDLIADMFFTGDMVIVEIKTGVAGECLDFQTMFYCWASYKWNFRIPRYVIKRTLAKPRIKLSKGEKQDDFIKRLFLYEYKIKAQVREMDIGKIKEFEKYLKWILSEIKLDKPYSFYKPPGEYWG